MSIANQFGVVIESISVSGLHLRDHERGWFEPWDAVREVQAARIPHAQSEALVLALGMGDERVILVPEFDPHWEALSDAIHRVLPDTPHPSVWRALLMKPGMLTIYSAYPNTH